MKLAGQALNASDGHEVAFSLLAQLWLAETGRPLPEIRRTQRGKPYFPDENYHFSVTHTKKHAFCVLSSHPVGIDAEELDRRIQPALAEKILSPGEMAQYTAAADKNRALLTFWVLKEAAAKCTGEGLRGYPKHTDFSLNDPRVKEMMGCLVAIIEDEE